MDYDWSDSDEQEDARDLEFIKNTDDEMSVLTAKSARKTAKQDYFIQKETSSSQTISWKEKHRPVTMIYLDMMQLFAISFIGLLGFFHTRITFFQSLRDQTWQKMDIFQLLFVQITIVSIVLVKAVLIGPWIYKTFCDE